jgi:nuclear transport factor 2 (NTF2) superfamily protein
LVYIIKPAALLAYKEANVNRADLAATSYSSHRNIREPVTVLKGTDNIFLGIKWNKELQYHRNHGIKEAITP